MMSTANNGHAENAGSRATMTAKATAAMLMRIGAMSHHATPRNSQEAATARSIRWQWRDKAAARKAAA
jgi:hypothetical protein